MPPRRRTSTSPQASPNRRAAGALLRAWRLERDLTQGELAAALGLPAGSLVSQFETGHRPLPTSLYGTYAAALGREPQIFARALIRHAEPALHRMLFGAAPGDGPPSRNANGRANTQSEP